MIISLYRSRCAVVYAVMYVGVCMLLAAGRVAAQIPTGIQLDTIPDSIRQKHMVHVSPHLIVFDPSTKTATVEFSNEGNTTAEADVEVQLGYTYWQNADTALVPPPGKIEHAHDTVVFGPGPQEHYAGAWLSGLPTHVVLAAHQTKTVTLRINPPAHLPDGEYYARIVTLVGTHVKRARVSQDTKQPYAFPIHGWDLPGIRDSARVFYRQGVQTMGLKIVGAKAQVDVSRNYPIDELGLHPLRILLQVHLTGTAAFEGEIRMSYLRPTGDSLPLTGSEGSWFMMRHDGIMRWSAETDHLTPGHYHLLIRFLPKEDEFPLSQRIPMQKVEMEIPIDIPKR